jgi:hypothetical protein
MTMIVEQSVKHELAGETEVLGENLPQCHFVHHKSHMTYPRLPRWEAGELWHGLNSMIDVEYSSFITGSAERNLIFLLQI